MKNKLAIKNILIILLVKVLLTFWCSSDELNPCIGKPPGTFTANPRACDKFYYCSQNETAIKVFCPEGMWFNNEKSICDVPTHVECVIEPEPNTPPTEEIICPDSSVKDVVFIPSKIDCNIYYLCYHGNAVKQECIPELHWNEKLQKCDFPHNANCTALISLPQCPPSGQKLYPHPRNCNYFIYCVNGHSSIQQCPFYHHYDRRNHTCVWRTRARCYEVDEDD